ncbi:MAG: alpha-1,2-fucosyltransferase [Rhodocyclaceae bacterium]|nr:alpha-1,2-fucosyltransferase [Rhodocyclaceae bacterium]
MKRVVVRLIGGLGNQMFQYAAARALSLKIDADVALDLSWFGTDPDRQYALAPLSIQASLAEPMATPNRSNSFWTRVARRLGLPRHERNMSVFSEASFRYDPRFETLQAPVFLDGYFQSEKYFRQYRDQLLKELCPHGNPSQSNARMLEEIRSKGAICLHIRRGDYVSNAAANAYHGMCSLDYYQAGLDIVAPTLANPHCFVFSDDPNWVRENFRPAVPMTLVDINGPGEAHEDLRLMAACSRFVIANSSLSWWGAWLSRADEKMVVAPARWFQTSQNDTRDLLPEGWLKV